MTRPRNLRSYNYFLKRQEELQKRQDTLQLYRQQEKSQFLRRQEQSQIIMLVKIGSKLRAEAIVDCHPEDQYQYVVIRCRNASLLEPGLVALMFPEYANVITWSDVFVLNRGLNSVSGIAAIKNTPGMKPIQKCPKNAQSAVRYCDESVVYSYSVTDWITFNGSLKNFRVTMEFIPRDVHGKRKESPENEIPAPKVASLPAVPPEPIVRKALVNIKTAQPKQVSIPVKATKQQPVVQTTAIKAENGPKVSFDVRDSEFVPITSESISHILNTMKIYEQQDRVVTIVFDQCFNQPDITLAAIRKKFEPFFGTIGHDCVMIKTNLNQMMPNPEEAYSRQFLFKGQAYLIGPKGLSKTAFLSKVSQSTILFGIMTMGCVVLNLKRGSYLVNRRALQVDYAPKTTVISQPVKESSKGKRIRYE